LALWGSQRIGYGSIYHAYEDFVRQSVAVAKGKPGYGGRRIHTLFRDMALHFGKRVADDRLASRHVREARLVRNALAHHGGKETAQLKALGHHLAVEQGMLQIMASDTRALLDLLQRRAYRLVEAAAVLPEIRMTKGQ